MPREVEHCPTASQLTPKAPLFPRLSTTPHSSRQKFATLLADAARRAALNLALNHSD